VGAPRPAPSGSFSGGRVGDRLARPFAAKPAAPIPSLYENLLGNSTSANTGRAPFDAVRNRPTQGGEYHHIMPTTVGLCEGKRLRKLRRPAPHRTRNREANAHLTNYSLARVCARENTPKPPHTQAITYPIAAFLPGSVNLSFTGTETEVTTYLPRSKGYGLVNKWGKLDGAPRPTPRRRHGRVLPGTAPRATRRSKRPTVAFLERRHRLTFPEVIGPPPYRPCRPPGASPGCPPSRPWAAGARPRRRLPGRARSG